MSFSTRNIRGIIVKKRLFMERDLFVTLLTEEGECLELLAKGAGGGKSRRRSHLDSFNLVRGTIYQGKSHPYLQEVQSECSFSNMKQKLDHVMQMQLFFEMIDRSVHANDPHPELFKVAHNILQELNQKESHPAATELAFAKLADSLGFLGSFKHCSSCHNKIEDDSAAWASQSAAVLCKNCCSQEAQALPLKFRKALEYFKLASHRDLKSIHFQADELFTLKSILMQSLLKHFDPPLKSLKMM